MSNTDKILEPIANDVVLAYLRDHLEPCLVYERDDCLELSTDEINMVYDKAVGALSALAAFFERTIE